MSDEPITKESLFDELVARIKEELDMITRFERMIRNENDPDTLSTLTRSYHSVMAIYNDSCKNLILLKGWNYSDKNEKAEFMKNIRTMLQEKELPKNVRRD